MKEQMNKKMYETPSTKRSLVEMEGGICATSGETQKKATLETEGHQAGTEIDASTSEWEQ